MENVHLIRRNKISNVIRNGEMCIIFSGKNVRLSRDQNYNFVVNKNFFYLTGIENENLILFMKKVNGDMKSILFIENREKGKIKWIGETILKDEAKNISCVDEVKYLDEFDSFLNESLLSEESPVIYFDFDRENHNYDLSYSENFANNLKVRYPNLILKNVYPILTKLRVIKDSIEILKIKEAIDITKLGILNILRNLKPNMYEYQIESYFDFMIKYSGAKNHSFKSIVASGINATILHYEKNDNKIENGDLVLFDLGAEKDFYKSDISRTFPANGKFSERQKEIYNIVLSAELKVIDFIRPGITNGELNEIAKKTLYEGLKRVGKLNDIGELSKYYYHGIGHLLGLDTHDVGDRDFVYEEGMIVTIEPGIYIEDEKIGIRIEDDVLVTRDGCEVLSKDIIKTVEEIEEFMLKNK